MNGGGEFETKTFIIFQEMDQFSNTSLKIFNFDKILSNNNFNYFYFSIFKRYLYFFSNITLKIFGNNNQKKKGFHLQKKFHNACLIL